MWLTHYSWLIYLCMSIISYFILFAPNCSGVVVLVHFILILDVFSLYPFNFKKQILSLLPFLGHHSHHKKWQLEKNKYTCVFVVLALFTLTRTKTFCIEDWEGYDLQKFETEFCVCHCLLCLLQQAIGLLFCSTTRIADVGGFIRHDTLVHAPIVPIDNYEVLVQSTCPLCRVTDYVSSC